MDISAVRAGLGSAASTVTGLRTYGFEPGYGDPPFFAPGEVDVDFDQAMHRGLDEALVTCRVAVSRADDRAGQLLLDGYLRGSGTTSLKAAIEADRTLGGVCQTLRVERISGYGMVEIGGETFYGALLSVRVWGSG